MAGLTHFDGAGHAHMVDGAADLIVSKRAPRVQRVIEEASADR